MKKQKLVRFKAACAGEYSRLKFSDNYVSNAHWIAARALFSDVPHENDEGGLRALLGEGAKPWACAVERLTDAQMIGKVPAGGRREYTRTALRWEDGGGPGHDAACFLADDGARLWLRLGYVRAFAIECVSGHGPEDPCAVVVDGADVLVLRPCAPPNDQQALRVLLAVADGESVAALREVVEEKPRAKKVRSPSRRAVEAALPDPRAVAAEGATCTGFCAAVGCDEPKAGKLWCARHTAPETSVAAVLDRVGREGDEKAPRTRQRLAGLYLVASVVRNDARENAELCESHAAEERRKTVAAVASADEDFI